MAKDTDMKSTPNIPGTNPNVYGQDGQVNPSAPTAGTEGWGNTTDERNTLSDQYQSPPNETNRDRASGDNQAVPTRSKGVTASSMNTSHGGQDRTFRCADVGDASCTWETSGTTDEIVQRAEEHGRTHHGLADWTEALRNKVRDAIRDRRAA